MDLGGIRAALHQASPYPRRDGGLPLFPRTLAHKHGDESGQRQASDRQVAMDRVRRRRNDDDDGCMSSGDCGPCSRHFGVSKAGHWIAALGVEGCPDASFVSSAGWRIRSTANLPVLILDLLI